MYYATSAPLAPLEMGSYIPSPRVVPRDYMLGVFELETDDIERIEASSLPEGWGQYPPPTRRKTQATGTHFCK
ncbi:hypothetical protein LOKO_02484 [Halomonas chromatireducens]|uniref:RES domain protein n=2 Tax=Halomonas chromatireducens TaxID=507626 RepID=A0A0X8HFA6_9GAMM|nr:hypothetical protein LOKO_02484 [Halomonas chromatireducens]